jgi:hypothetical protein
MYLNEETHYLQFQTKNSQKQISILNRVFIV